MKIEKNTVVTFDYILKDEDGNVLEDTEGQGSSYLHGYGNLLPALEEALEGLEPGDTLKKNLTVDEGFGAYDDTLVISFPISEFGDNKPEVGQEILMPNDDGDDVIFEVVEIEDGMVTLDGNHPYADMPLDFEITVKDVREATPEEIEAGDIEYDDDCCCGDDDCDCGCHHHDDNEDSGCL
ncbi:MAG: peptidylprolyl isomerase [Spirochaetia bacterium]|nr:peptidylprolyl isomerase [Spirochaetia bacterium]